VPTGRKLRFDRAAARARIRSTPSKSRKEGISGAHGRPPREVIGSGSKQFATPEKIVSDHFFNQEQLARRWGLSPLMLERWRWRRHGPVYFKLRQVTYRVAWPGKIKSERWARSFRFGGRH